MQQLPVLDALHRLGGVTSRAALVGACGRPAVDAALADGTLIVLARGVYASADVDDDRAAAAALSGVLARRSAAVERGWAVLTRPDKPDVLVPRGRKVRADRAAAVTLHRGDLAPEEVEEGRTGAERTLVDCLRSLTFVEGLAVADSALRSGFPSERLASLARDVRGAGAARVRSVASVADGRAANPFESALRAICLDVEGLDAEPQVEVRDPQWLGRPDLVDRRLRMVVEADSFEWHGGRAALHRDANRYNAFVVAGWTVLRFSWEEVMFHPVRVRATLQAVVAGRAEVRCPGCRAAWDRGQRGPAGDFW